MTPPDQPTTGHAKLRPRARLISLIGDELISDEAVAVVELVKNAYDADASNVRVIFTRTDAVWPNELIISDDGVGMTLQQVLSCWFEPGTPSKKQIERSPGGRQYLGAKGIGRFAAARLSSSLFMETKSVGSPNAVSVLLDWGKFDDDSYLDEISIDYESSASPDKEHGTSLTLLNLGARKFWGESDFRSLHTRLSRLISPFQNTPIGSDVSEFEIQLVIPGYAEFTGKVEPHELTTKPKYCLRGTLAADGTFSGRIEVDGQIHKEIISHRLGKKDEPVLCGGFEVEIRAWDRDKVGLAPFMLSLDQNLGEVRKILDEYCGVSIYRDGFRVHPYGERGNDWLGLDTRSRQSPTRCLANNQLIAAIRISREANAGLRDRTTREGLVHTAEYNSLIEWFTRVLTILEAERYLLRPRDSKSSEYVTTLFEPFDMSDVVKEVDTQLGKSHPVSTLVHKKDSDIRDGIKKLHEHYSRVMLAAGLGQLVDLVVHEIGSPLGRITREIEFVESKLMNGLSDSVLDRLLGEGSYSQIRESFDGIFGWLEQLAALRERLVPKTAGRRARTSTFVVQEEIQGNLALFESLILKQKIVVTVEAPKESVVVHMPRSNLAQILANLLDNSIYWLAHHHGDGKGGQLLIRLTELQHGISIAVSDNGQGVAEEDRDRIFDQEFSRKPNGMGLGLFIARQVIEPYGRLIYRDDGQLPGACFEARFEQKVGL